MCLLRNIALESVTGGRMDRQTDGQTDNGQSDPYVSLCFAGDTKTLVIFNYQIIKHFQIIKTLSKLLKKSFHRFKIIYVHVSSFSLIILKLSSRRNDS